MADEPAHPSGSPILISFKELQSINDRLTRLATKLDVALTLPSQIQDLDKRVTDLETERAVRSAKGGVYGKAWEFVYALILAFIAAGVWLPKLH